MKNPKSLFQKITHKKYWYYNINQEQEWNESRVFPSMVDVHQLEIVRMQEQQMLYIAAPEDTVLFRHHPDAGFLSYLQSNGLKLPHIQVIQSLEENWNKAESAMLIPYIQTNDTAKLALNDNVVIFGGDDHELVKEINNKFLTRKFAEIHDFRTTRGFFCTSRDELTNAYHELRMQGFDKCVIKIPFGSSGKGMKVIDGDKSFEAVLKFITKRNDRFELLLEGWYEVKQNINCQLWIGDQGPEILAVTQQAIDGQGVYLGTDFLPQYDDRVVEEYRSEMLRLGKLLMERGYYGICGIDSIIDFDNNIYPVIEINARFTQVTYILPLIHEIAQKSSAVINGFLRFEIEEEQSFDQIHSVLNEKLQADKDNRFFVYTFARYKVPDSSKVIYRIFCVFYGTNAGKIEEMCRAFQGIDFLSKPMKDRHH